MQKWFVLLPLQRHLDEKRSETQGHRGLLLGSVGVPQGELYTQMGTVRQAIPVTFKACSCKWGGVSPISC
jgi:hypothetical protein